MKTNDDILKTRIAAFNERTGPRVGDYIYIPSNDDRIPEYTRITHDWGDKLQTGGAGSGYYLNESGYLNYSGGLDPGINTADLIPTDETRPGNVWFFDKDIHEAGRGITFNIPMRVFTVKPNADTSGIYSRQCPYYLQVLDIFGHKSTCNYWYTITKHAISYAAFKTEAELRLWLGQNRLNLTAELTAPGILSFQKLKYSK